jgi:hypothetical protein
LLPIYCQKCTPSGDATIDRQLNCQCN